VAPYQNPIAAPAPVQHVLEDVVMGALLGALGCGLVGTVLIGTSGMSSFFLYLSNSPYVMIEHYHLTPRGFSLLFSVNAASFFIAAQFNGAVASRIGLKALVRRASTGFAVSMLVLLSLFAAGVDHLVVMVVLLCCAYACLGMTVPNATVLALEEHGAIAGTASSLPARTSCTAVSLS